MKKTVEESVVFEFGWFMQFVMSKFLENFVKLRVCRKESFGIFWDSGLIRDKMLSKGRKNLDLY